MMPHLKRWLFPLIVALALAALACSDDDDAPPDSNTCGGALCTADERCCGPAACGHCVPKNSRIACATSCNTDDVGITTEPAVDLGPRPPADAGSDLTTD